jgi:hypothetical protein
MPATPSWRSRDVLAAWLRVLGADHPDTLTTAFLLWMT